MTRRNIFEVTEEILKILKKEKELSIKAVAGKTDAQWRTAQKSLEFLKNVGLVKERLGKVTNKPERLFSLTDPKASYGKK